MRIKWWLLSLLMVSIGLFPACDLSLRTPKVGIIMSQTDNAFITSILKGIEAAHLIMAADKVELVKMDSLNQQSVQNQQVDELIAQKVKVMVVNLIDRTAALDIIGKARAADIPVIFINLEPFSTDLSFYERAYYVGSIAEMAGGLQAEIALDLWRSQPNTDKNQDGIMQYVTLMGESGHPDARIRTNSSRKFLEMEGVKVQNLGEVNAHWGRLQAKNTLLSLMQTSQDRVEVVFANNDLMAIGAIDALRELGYFQAEKFMPVIGVDAVPMALSAIENGFLSGTVLNDVQGQGRAVMDLVLALLRGDTITGTTLAPLSRSDGAVAPDGHFILVPYLKVTRENFREFKPE